MKSLESIYESIDNNPNKKDLIARFINCIDGKYNIRDDGSFDITGSVFINDYTITEIPCKINKLTEDFRAPSSSLKTLKNLPDEVSTIECSNTKIVNLVGAPRSVKILLCQGCKLLKSLDGFPDKVTNRFRCNECTNLPRSELYRIVDKVKGRIYYENRFQHEDKDQLKRDRDRYLSLHHNELGNLDV